MDRNRSVKFRWRKNRGNFDLHSERDPDCAVSFRWRRCMKKLEED